MMMRWIWNVPCADDTVEAEKLYLPIAIKAAHPFVGVCNVIFNCTFTVIIVVTSLYFVKCLGTFRLQSELSLTKAELRATIVGLEERNMSTVGEPQQLTLRLAREMLKEIEHDEKIVKRSQRVVITKEQSYSNN